MTADQPHGATFKFSDQERVHFGGPLEDALAKDPAVIAASRVFVTSTRSLTSMEGGPLQRVVAALGDKFAGRFTSIAAHGPGPDVISAADAAREADADLLIAVGGGSVIDATKAMLMCLWEDIREEGQFAEVWPRYKGSGPQAPGGPERMISVSTTLSAAEFNATAGVTDLAKGQKFPYTHSRFVPIAAILDPSATVNTPERLLAATGVRAVDHAVEGYCSPSANTMTDLLALAGLRNLAQGLRAIKHDARSLEHRERAQVGAWQSITAVTGGARGGASHGIGYALGAGFGVAHGETSCIMLPAVLRWNSSVNGERQKAIATAMSRSDLEPWQAVQELVQDLGLPSRLRDVSVPYDQLDRLAELALDYEATLNNPRRITSAAQVREILELAW
jgi:maleylacetate reductase